MQQNRQYVLHEFHNVSYLLPFGQNVADLRSSLSINETGVFLWKALERDLSWDEIWALFLEEYEIPTVSENEIAREVRRYLSYLIEKGVVVDQPEVYQHMEICHRLLIGDLSVELCGEMRFFSDEFLPFCVVSTNDQKADLTISVQEGEIPLRETGEILLHDGELVVIRLRNRYQLLFPSLEKIHCVYLSFDGSDALIYVNAGASKECSEEIFHVIRHLFLYKAARMGLYAIHSASILYRDKAWLFSGHSGMGKSTHVNLWHTLFRTPILNGDLNLLGIKDGIPTVYGLPWCGTSGISTIETYPLGGIILLNRDSTDHMEELPADRAALLVMQRFISPTWEKEQILAAAEFADSVSEKVLVRELYCTKDRSAAECARKGIFND